MRPPKLTAVVRARLPSRCGPLKRNSHVLDPKRETAEVALSQLGLPRRQYATTDV